MSDVQEKSRVSAIPEQREGGDPVAEMEVLREARRILMAARIQLFDPDPALHMLRRADGHLSRQLDTAYDLYFREVR